MKKDKKIKKIKKIKKKKLLMINFISEDLETTKKYTKKFDDFFTIIDSNNELIELIRERKDKKYAALTVELCSIMEAFLKDLYSVCEEKEFDTKNKPDKKSIIEALEDELEGNCINLGNKGKLKLLNKMRNEMVHNNGFSFKKAKKSLLKDKKVKSIDILSQLINDSEKYVKNIKIL